MGSVTQVGIVHLIPGFQSLGAPYLPEVLETSPTLTTDAEQG